MQLYYNSKGQWSGTQADARKTKKENDGLSFESINVPTDKKGLLEFLNQNQVKSQEVNQVPIDPVIIKSGNTTNTPLTYIKDDVGVSEVTNVFDNLRDAYISIQHIMEKLGHNPNDTSLLKDEYFEGEKTDE
tara:strand:+ start:346 stop:741 length:396 start_codon:yes stop_codon:yes gene_type:complete